MHPPAPALPRSLFLFALVYGGAVCMAGVLGTKLIALGPLAVEGGIVAFLLLVVLSSATAELHGEAAARTLVRWGFVPLLLSMALIRLVLALPAAAAMEPARLRAFEAVLAQGTRLMLAGLIAYGVSQTINVRLFGRLRATMGTVAGGRHVALRAGLAGAAAQVADTLIFVTVAFAGTFPLLPILIGQMIAKLVLSAVLVPPAVAAAVAWGRRVDGAPAAPLCPPA